MNLRSILVVAAVAVAMVNAQATTKPPACREVSVEGDATYCIQGAICSGKADKPAAGTACPKVSDVAVKDCLKKLKSYTNADKCVAPVNAECKAIKTGVWGCVWPSATTTTTTTVVPATTTPAPKPANATIAATTAPPATTKPATQVTPAAGACREVSVEGDATFCIAGPVCSGKGDKAASTNCPKIGDVAVKDCLKKLKSYTNADKCVAPVNAECKKGKGDIWGCVWGAAPAATTAAPAATTKAPTTAPVTTAPAATTKALTTAPVTTAPAATTKAATAAPATTTVGPAVITPGVTTPAPTTPAVTTPNPTTPAVTTPNPTTPAVTTPAVTTPNPTTPAVTTPNPTTPAVTVPIISNLAAKVDEPEAATDGGATAAAGCVAAAAAIAAAVFVVRRKQQKQKQQQDDAALRNHVNIITP